MQISGLERRRRVVVGGRQPGAGQPPTASRCGCGSNGYIGFTLSGNPQFLDIKETILGGTGRLAGTTGAGTGTVSLHGGVAIGKTSGTITIP